MRDEKIELGTYKRQVPLLFARLVIVVHLPHQVKPIEKLVRRPLELLARVGIAHPNVGLRAWRKIMLALFFFKKLKPLCGGLAHFLAPAHLLPTYLRFAAHPAQEDGRHQQYFE